MTPSSRPSKPFELDVTDAEWNELAAILATHLPGREVWAFGSRTTGRAKRYSDLDLAVIGSTPWPIAEQAALREAFSDSNLAWKVDVVDWSALDEGFRHIIAAHKLVLPTANR